METASPLRPVPLIIGQEHRKVNAFQVKKPLPGSVLPLVQSQAANLALTVCSSGPWLVERAQDLVRLIDAVASPSRDLAQDLHADEPIDVSLRNGELDLERRLDG